VRVIRALGVFLAAAGLCPLVTGAITGEAAPRLEYVYAGEWGGISAVDGEAFSPWGVATAPDGRVYVSVFTQGRIEYFKAEGAFVGSWGEVGEGSGEFRWPSGVAVAPNGDVYVADSFNHRVQYFTSSGSYRGAWG
jgi:tripartite motif-containing protein 71